MTVQDVLIQYESRLHELHAGMVQARLHYNFIGVVLVIAVALFLILSLLATRQPAALWWPALPIPSRFAIAAALCCLVVFAGGYIPARRAAGVNPLVALRHE